MRIPQGNFRHRLYRRLHRLGIPKVASGRVRAAARLVLPAAAFLWLGSVPALGQIFDMTVIDPRQAGDCKAAGDINGDGLPDLVVGGFPEERLTWYRYPGWDKTVVATARKEFTTDCALGDVDGDGDLDIVVPDGNEGVNLVWFENRSAAPGESATGGWPRHDVGAIGDWGKDVELADFDNDGRMDVATRGPDRAMIFFQSGKNTWTRVDLADVPLGDEGMGSGDIDGDGFADLVLYGAWVRNPGKDRARDGRAWQSHPIGSVDPSFKATVADIDGDGRNDVLFSSSESTADVVWFRAESGDPESAWTRHVLAQSVERAHTLQAGDVDGDGDTDIVFGQMHTSKTKLLVVSYNLDGRGTAWRRDTIGRSGLHNGVLVDIGNDGLLDVFGANWAGNPPVRLWRQRKSSSAAPLAPDFWSVLTVTKSHRQTFGLGFADANGDGRDDIVAGRFVYLNPGGDLSGDWTRHTLPDGMDAFGALDVDGDARVDLIAQSERPDGHAIVWLEPEDQTLTKWKSRQIGIVPKASHGLGAQGYRVADLIPGGKPKVAVSSGNGIYIYQVPAAPDATDWPRVHVSANPSDEGFAVGDIDRDGFVDIAAATGESKRVEWYRNPGPSGGAWTVHPVGDMKEAVYPDRVALADLNGDGRLDVIVTEENGQEDGAKTYWWAQPTSIGSAAAWPRHLLTTQATTHGLDVGDIDGDGDVDLVTGEHRGAERTILWENDRNGRFTAREIVRGIESHLGSRLHDLDGDGDLDIVNIAWDDAGLLWIARNDAVTRVVLLPGEKPASSAGTALGNLAHKLRRIIQRWTN